MTKLSICACFLATMALAGCEQKPAAPATPATPTTARQHISTDREAFKAAGKAADQIENKGAERNSAVDDAMKAGE